MKLVTIVGDNARWSSSLSQPRRATHICGNQPRGLTLSVTQWPRHDNRWPSATTLKAVRIDKRRIPAGVKAVVIDTTNDATRVVI